MDSIKLNHLLSNMKKNRTSWMITMIISILFVTSKLVMFRNKNDVWEIQVMLGSFLVFYSFYSYVKVVKHINIIEKRLMRLNSGVVRNDYNRRHKVMNWLD